jgi:DNA repair protein RadC
MTKENTTTQTHGDEGTRTASIIRPTVGRGTNYPITADETPKGLADLMPLGGSPRLAELKVSYRRGKAAATRPKTVFATSEDCGVYLRSLWDRDTLELREEFVVVCLNGANEVIGWVRLHAGAMNTTAVDPRLVLGVALRTASSAIVIAHNHPSGSLTPSEEDRALTRRLSAACRIVGVRFLDHVIVTGPATYSFADRGEL